MEYTQAGYQALVQDIFRRFPSVQQAGFQSGAYKPGLERMRAFDRALGYPSRQFKAIHVAGTNGKGSVANMLASAFSACGIRTGLFTSPHLLDFRERMRVAGAMIPQEYVFDFLTQWLPWCTEHQLSFFEITTGMAFRWFADRHVEAAVIEVGLGGRLDSTNILERPELAVVTTIGLDHMALLGDTLEQIAAEKAGIFKPGVPALVGEYQPETAPVFAPFHPVYADRVTPQLWPRHEAVLQAMDLQAAVQRKNLRTVLAAVDLLRPVFPALEDADALLDGVIHTARRMGFRGRWERLRTQPLVLADIGHNAQALRHNFSQLEAPGRPLIIVYGIMADKDLDAILPLMPAAAAYIFTAPDTPRALPAAQLLARFVSQVSAQTVAGEAANRRRSPKIGPPATQIGPTDNIPSQVSQKTRTCDANAPDLRQDSAPEQQPCRAMAVPDVRQAVEQALAMADQDTIIYIGGSTFVVAEALPLF